MTEGIRAVGYLCVAVGFLLFIVLMGTASTTQTTVANMFQNSVQTELYVNRDDSARAKRGDFFINQTAFEKSVVADMITGGRTTTATDPAGITPSTGNDTNPNDGIKFTYAVETPDGQIHYYSKPSDVATGTIRAVKAQSQISNHSYQTNAVISKNSVTAQDDITNRGK